VGAAILIQLYSHITGEADEDIQHPSQLSGKIVTREQIERVEYESLSKLICELRNVYSASGLRCLRSDAATRKTPVLNLLRQIARANGLALEASRKANGYAPDGRKQFQYWYTFSALDGLDKVPRIDTHNPRLIKQHDTPDEPDKPAVISGTLVLPPESN